MNPESAAEILDARLTKTVKELEVAETQEIPKSSKRQEKSLIETVMASSVTRTVGRELVKGIFGVLFGSAQKTTNRRR